MFRRFFYGRYGSDKLNIALAVLILVIGILSNIFDGYVSAILWTLQIACCFWFFFRMLSRNHLARRREEAWFMGLFGKVKNFFSGKKKVFDDKEHKYFKCPKCSTKLRVPRGRGTITVTCPKCGHKFDKKS